MRFDANGHRISSVCNTHQIHEDVVVDLGSKFDGISDKSIQIVREMVKYEDMNKLDNLLITLGNLSKTASC